MEEHVDKRVGTWARVSPPQFQVCPGYRVYSCEAQVTGCEEKMEEHVELTERSEHRDKSYLMSETDPLPSRPDTHWWPALGAMILCCMPCGIIALVSAYQAEDHYDMGNYAGAVKLSRRAMRWIWLSVLAQVIYIVSMVIYVVVLSVIMYNAVAKAEAAMQPPPMQ